MFRVRVIYSIIGVLWILDGFAQTGPQSAVLGNFRTSKISINSYRNEYAPVYRNGKLLFTSDNFDRIGVYFSSTDSVSQLSGIYWASRENDTVFSDPRLIDDRLNRCYNSGPAWMNASAKHLYFSSNETSAFLLFTSKKKSKLQLYESVLQNRNWSKRKKLSFCTSSSNYTHPYLNEGEDTLYLASDRPGGFGGFDLYYSVRQNGSWSEPMNLGAAVNSPKNDLFPFYDGTQLVFSSDRAYGKGKLDLYAYTFEGERLQHLGDPFNSAADDFAYSALDRKRGYFSTNRDGNDEIYFYSEIFPDFRDCEPYVKDPFCYTFFEEADELDTLLHLEYVWSFGDGNSATGREARHCFDGYGDYLVELNIVDHTTSEVFYNQTSYPFSIKRSQRLHIEGPDTIPTSHAVLFTAEHSTLESYQIERFFWHLDDGEITVMDTNQIALVFNEEGTHLLTLGIWARASDGSVEKQSCITKTITVQKGAKLFPVKGPAVIPVDREFSAKSTDYQYTLFLGVSDTLLDVETIDSKDSLRIQSVGDSLYLYSMGISDQKKTFLGEYRNAHEMGFPESQVTQIKNGQLIQAQKLAHTELVEVENILDNRIKNEQIITSLEIFYGFDVSALSDDDKQEIRKLALGQQNSSNRILISSFTDVRGRGEYNLKLSKKRSLAVRDELVKNGFPVARIEMEYFGKRVPRDMEPLSDAQRRKSLIIVYEKN